MNYQWTANQQILKYIDTLLVQTKYINLIVLDNQNRPLRAIQGRATGGSININGNSPVRRSGSISLITDYDESMSGLDIMNRVSDVSTLLSLNKRLSIEIGILNSGNQYADFPIFWFPLGIFLFSNASVKSDAAGISVDMTLIDKMGLLNGEVGGEIVSLTTFSPDGDNDPARFYDIIYQLLTEFGHLSPEEIIIEDVPKDINALASYQESEYSRKYGKTPTSFTYPSDEKLIANAGETVVSVLDKIKNQLGAYEYFFDINGIFHFRLIKDYTLSGSSKNTITAAVKDKAEIYLTYSAGEKFTYSFEQNSPLIIAYQNTPAYSKLKNDFHIWGQTTETKSQIHYHLFLSDIAERSHIYYPNSLMGSKEAGNTDTSIKQVYDQNAYNRDSYKYQAVIGGEEIVLAQKTSGTWIPFDWSPTYAEKNGQRIESPDYKVNNYCSNAEFLPQQIGSSPVPYRNLTYYQMPLPESGQMYWDGADIFTRWIIDPSQQIENGGAAAQVLWSRADPRKYGMTKEQALELYSKRDDMGSGSGTEGAEKQRIKITGNYVICRIRISNPKQKARISMSILPPAEDEDGKKAYPSKIKEVRHRMNCWLDLEQSQTMAQTWHTYYIDLSTFKHVHQANYQNYEADWSKDKEVATLIFTFSWAQLSDKSVLRNTVNYVDFDFIAFSDKTRWNDENSLLTKLKALYPNDYIVKITGEEPVGNSSNCEVKQIASTYIKKPSCHWAQYLYAEAYQKQKYKLHLQPHEKEILEHKFSYKGTTLTWIEPYYYLDLLDTSQLKSYPKLHNYIASHGIENIGLRTKSIPDEKVNCLFETYRADEVYVTVEQAKNLTIIQDAAKKEWYYIIPSDEDPSGWSKTQLTKGNLNSKTSYAYNYMFAKGFYEKQEDGSFIQRYSFEDPNQKYYCLTSKQAETLQIGLQEKSALSTLRKVLHEYLSYNNRINLTTVPIYHLDANQRIHVECDEADIYGDYIIESINLPLDFESPMSISARQIMERI